MGYLAYLPLNPLGRPAPYTAKVISLKAKEIQPTRPPKAPFEFAPTASPRLACYTLRASPHRLDNSHYGSNFSRLHLGGKNSLNLIILTAPGVVFVILRLTGRARERSRGSKGEMM